MIQLYFHQQSPNTQTYFVEKYGRWHSISLAEIPHNITYQDKSYNTYKDYIRAIWGGVNPKLIKKQAKKYKDLLNDILSLEKMKIYIPIEIVKHPSKNRYFIVDGNHRASIAHFLGIKIPYKEITLQEWVERNMPTNGKFSAQDGIPYQSFSIGSAITKGRREDVSTIHQLIRSEDIKGKKVLDLGCNIGSHTYTAKANGASEVWGVEKYYEMLLFAMRLNNFYEMDNVFFKEQDLNETYNHNADTVFCFSVDAHLENKQALLNTLKQAKNCIYLECHAGKTEEDYLWILNEFSSYEFLGCTDDGKHTDTKSRRFYRIQV